MQAPALPRVGRYSLDETLATHPYGSSYLARDGERKVVVHELLTDEATLADPRHQEELRALTGLFEKHLSSVRDAFLKDSYVYIVRPFEAGETLASQLVPDQPWPSEKALVLIQKIGYGLDYLHSRGMVHGAVTPSNVILLPDANCKLVDFAVRTTAARFGTCIERHDPDSLPYLAPEQLQGRAATAKSDQFALAVIAFRLLTGRFPFDGEDPVALLEAMLANRRRSPKDWKVNLPDEAEQALHCALDVVEGNRFKDCASFFEKLFIGFRGSPAKQPDDGKRRLFQRITYYFIALVVISLLIGFFTAYYARGRFVEPQKNVGDAEQTNLLSASATLAVSPDGTRLIAATLDDELYAFDLTARKQLWKKPFGCRRQIQFPLAFSPDGSYVIGQTGSEADAHTTIWRASTGELAGDAPGAVNVHSGIGSTVKSSSVAVIRPGSHPVAALLEVSSGDPIHTYSPFTAAAVALSADAAAIAIGSPDGQIHIGDRNGRISRTLNSKVMSMQALAFSPDGRLLTVGGKEAVEIYDLRSGSLMREVGGAGIGVRWLSFLPGSDRVAIMGRNQNLQIIESTTATVLATFRQRAGTRQEAAFADSGAVIATSGTSAIELWDPANGQYDPPRDAHDGLVMSVAISPNGRTIVASTANRNLQWFSREMHLKATAPGPVFGLLTGF